MFPLFLTQTDQLSSRNVDLKITKTLGKFYAGMADLTVQTVRGGQMRVCGFETSKNQKGREPKAHATPVAGTVCTIRIPNPVPAGCTDRVRSTSESTHRTNRQLRRLSTISQYHSPIGASYVDELMVGEDLGCFDANKLCSGASNFLVIPFMHPR